MNEYSLRSSAHVAYDTTASATAMLAQGADMHRSSARWSDPRHSAALPSAIGTVGAAGREDLPLDQISFRRLSTAADIARIAHLREEIQLPASTLADPVFRTREKKETNSGLSVLSSAAAS